MRIIVMKDYPDNLGEVIHSILHTDYTLTGYFGDTGLEWVLQYHGNKDTVLLEIACSEYILDTASVNTVYDYTGVYSKHLRDS